MNAWPRALVFVSLFLPAGVAHAADVAPALADDARVSVAADALRARVASLDRPVRHALRGVYLAVDPTRTDVLALPACDDDGDYVVVLSRALFELVQGVSLAAASDQLRGTALVHAYGDLLAHGQEPGALVLPPPVPADGDDVALVPIEDLTQTFEESLTGWIVANELAHAVKRDFVCPNPTVTYEAADDTWTSAEHMAALAYGPLRTTHLAEADAWATAHAGATDAPVLAWLDVMAAIQGARPDALGWSYVFVHPRARERRDAVATLMRERRDAERASRETSARGARMR